MASITKKSRSRYWFACFRDLQGKQRRLSTKQTDRRKAMKIAEQYEQISQRRLPVHTVRQTLTALAREAYGETFPSATVHQFIDAWLKGKAPPVVAQSTHDFYRKSTKKFLEFLGTEAELDLSAVTRKMITEFRNQVAQKASATTTNHDLKAIKLIFRSAKRDGYIIEDPSEFVESFRRRISDDARRPFTVSEIRSVIEVADKEWRSLVLFGLYTGQRLADVATLRWDNIDLARNEIRIKTRKTGKRLSIPIAPPLKTHIESLPAGHEGYLHPKAAATVTSQKRSGTLSNQFADLLAQAGLRDKAPHRSKGKGRDGKRSSNGLSFHALRHTAVSLLKDAGIPEAVVMELVGHDSEAMSAHYTHVGTEALAKAVSALPEI
jgi:integrase